MDDHLELRQLRERAEDAIASANQMLEERAERLAAGDQDRAAADTGEAKEWRWPIVETVERRFTPPPARQRPVTAYRDWTAEQRWIEQIFDQRIGPILDQRIAAATEEIVEATLEHLQKRFTRSRQLTNDAIAGVEDRLTKTEVATCELIAELERRIAELEQRAVPAVRVLPRVA